MEYVLTLLGRQGAIPVEALLAAEIRAALEEAGAHVAEPDWLAPGLACDLAFQSLDAAAAERLAAKEIGDLPLDLAVQPRAGRRKKLLLADMDSTVIPVECIDELADFAGRRAEVAAITERAMRGELDFPGALRERARMLAGLDESVLERCYAERVRLNPGARALVRTMRRHGAYTALVSGGFTFFTSRVREAAGFDYDQANRLEIAGGKLTGRVAEPILDARAKLAALERLTAQLGLDPVEVLAVGDGANDLPMIQAAGLGVAFHAKPRVAEAAKVRLRHGDLGALLYLQGYRAAEVDLG